MKVNNVNSRKGFRFETDYAWKFELASRYGNEYVLEEFKKTFPEAKKDYKKITELVAVLGVTAIKRSRDDLAIKDEEVVQTLCKLHNQARVWGLENLNGKEFEWLYKYTRA